MSCSSCGSTNCCGSSNCSCVGSSCCGNSVPSISLPYYASVPACQESHCQEIWVNKYPLCVKIDNPWNIPNIGAQATVIVNDATTAQTGSFLWNSLYGYFEIISFNASTHEMVIQNSGVDGNAAAGTLVPACSCFVVTVPPTEVNQLSNLYPYVALDFTAPNNGSCTLITVTNVYGVIVGKNVEIAGGVYRVSAVTPPDVIEICNDGDGLAGGTPVIALDGAGNYQYPVILVDASQCSNPEVTQGAIIVCNSGISQPLAGATAGMIPVLIDPVTNHAEYQIVACPTYTCTVLTSCVNITSGVSTYTLVVADTGAFAVNDIVQVGSTTDTFLITTIIDSTHMQGTWTPTPTTTYEIPVGTSVCILDVCADYENRVRNIFFEITDTTITLDVGNPSHISSEVDIDITNTSLCRTMQVLLVTTYQTRAVVDNGNTQDVEVRIDMEISIDGGPWVSEITQENSMYMIDDNLHTWDLNGTIGRTLFVNPGVTVNVRYRGLLDFLPPTGTGQYEIDSFRIGTYGIGVAI